MNMQADELHKIIMSKIDFVPTPYDTLIRRAGVEGILALLEEFGGTNIYVPTAKRLFSQCFEKQVYEEFDGRNIKALCKKFGLCERKVREIVSQ